MDDRTLNIADFQYRAAKTCAVFETAFARKGSGAGLLQSSRFEGRGASLSDAALAENAQCYDIELAREAQHMRPRAAFRLISIQRRAKVLRFRGAPPDRHLSSAAAGPYDLPPAA